jgi:hypothetical protein
VARELRRLAEIGEVITHLAFYPGAFVCSARADADAIRSSDAIVLVRRFNATS